MSLRVKDNPPVKNTALGEGLGCGQEPTDPAIISASVLPADYIGAPSYTFPQAWWELLIEADQ